MMAVLPNQLNFHNSPSCTGQIISIPRSAASSASRSLHPALAFFGGGGGTSSSTPPLLKKKKKNLNLNLIKKGSSSSVLLAVAAKAAAGDGGIINVPAVDDKEDGVSLGTMKLSPNVDIPRFETLLFQWANSLSQGANLPLPVPLKVDKIQGGARLGFIAVDDGKTEVCVYIDCLVFPAATGNSGPYFRAIRNGTMKEKEAPGEPRIMRSLMQALQKSADIARVL